MAPEYWVENSPSGRPRLKRSHTRPKDGHTPRPRKRTVDFLDVTRDEYDQLAERERALRETYQALERENAALKSNWQACDDEYRRIQYLIPQYQTQIRDLEHDNRELRRSLEGRGNNREREREDANRRIRNKNTKLQNENETLVQRIRSLERGFRDGVDDRVHRLMEQISAWKRRYERLDGIAAKLQQKVDLAAERNAQLEEKNERLSYANASLARQERKLRQTIDAYEAIMRRHGLMR